jgi:hypothetical protein
MIEIVSGYVSTITKKEWIKIERIDTFMVHKFAHEERYTFVAQIGKRCYVLGVYELEFEAQDAMDKFVIELTPEMNESDDD